MTHIGRSARVALVLLATFVLLTLALIGGPLPHLDETIRHWAVTHQNPGVRRVAVDARWFGDLRVAVPAMLASTAFVAWRVRRPRLLLLAGSLALLLLGLVEGLKIAVRRSDAPVAPHAVLGANGHSYPSGHVATAALCWGLLAIVIGAHVRRLAVVAAVVAATAVLITCWSVVYGPSHWLFDAVGAVLICAAGLAAFGALGGARLSRRRHS